MEVINCTQCGNYITCLTTPRFRFDDPMGCVAQAKRLVRAQEASAAVHFPTPKKEDTWNQHMIDSMMYPSQNALREYMGLDSESIGDKGVSGRWICENPS